MASRGEALRQTFSERSVRRSLTVAFFIGTLRKQIKQGPEFVTGHWPVWW